MTWNYRIIYHDKLYSVHEVYYDKKGRPKSWTKTPVDANIMESAKEVQEALLAMLNDVTKYPVLKIVRNKLVEVRPFKAS